MINLGADTGIADARVNCIGKIKRSRTSGELNHIALWREAEDLICVHFEFDDFKEGVVIFLGVKLLGQARHPFDWVHGEGVFGAHTVAVGPMRCYTTFGNIVHLIGADLNFNSLAVTARNGRMDRAIAV